MSNTKIIILFFFTCVINIQTDHAGEVLFPPVSTTDFFSDVDFLTGRIDYYNDPHFVEIPKQYAYREKMFLLKETYDAWLNMYMAAKKDGVTLKIISASRTHTEQKWIWEDKWTKPKYQAASQLDKIKNIMEFSAMPGTSRHHWGTEVDLNSTSEQYFESGIGKKTYDWLTTHACDFGFCQVYDASYADKRGHGEEKWHWSYLPVSEKLPSVYKEKVKYADISGFSGSEYADELNVIENYVLSVEANCCD